MRTAASCLFAIALSVSASSSAHVVLTSHESRDGRAEIKDGPCGLEGSTRGDVVHTFQAGETITLVWNEFIAHPGWYRISFDADGQDDFADPANYEDLYTNDAVLVDNLFPHERSDVRGPWTYDLELPDTPCTNCTVQLVQMMTDKAPYVVGTNDLYFNCLDLVLTARDGEDVGIADVGSPDVGPPDVEPDTGTDAGRDTTVDVEPDTGAEPDSGTDAESDSAGDAADSGGTDSDDQPSDIPRDDGASDTAATRVVDDSGCAAASGTIPALPFAIALLALVPRRKRLR